MAGNLLDRLGGLFGRHAAAPPAEATPAEAPPVETAPAISVEPAPVDSAQVPVEASAPIAAAPEIVAAVTEPVKSPVELLEERLWADTEAAWARGDFQTVTQRLDALKALEPEDATAIDAKIAAAQFNHAAQVEQSGDLQRALYLFQEAQRRNPNLGEASFAIVRVQAALAPPPAVAEPAPAAAPPAERTYTVEAGDSLSAIADKVYGSGNDWSRIFEANRDQLDNPDLIQPGQVLRIP
jgi:nucleoid-associated protein YgaU